MGGISLSRRHLLQLASSGAVLAASRAGAQGAFGAPPATIINTELKKLSATTFAFLQREAPGQSNYSVSNFGIVVGPRSLLAIDAGGGPQHARNFIASAKPLGKPFDRVVITHAHPDHIVGLTQFPTDIEIVAQEETRKQMTGMGAMPTPAHCGPSSAFNTS